MKSLKSKIGDMYNYTSGLLNPASWLTEYFGSNKSSTGIFVNVQSALGVPEIYNAVSKISGHIASMPMQVWQDRDGEKKQIKSRGADIWNRPGRWTRAEIVEKLMVDALLLGNGRLLIERDELGQPSGLLPIQSDTARTVMVNGERWHCITLNDAETAGANLKDRTGDGTMYKIPDRDVFYIMGLTTNGYWGENLLSLAKDIIGLSIAGAESAGTLYKNVGRPGILLEAPRGAFANAKDAQEFLQNFQNANDGLDNSGKTAMIKEGMKAIQMNWQGMDSSHVGMRQFQREASALLFLLESVIGTDASVYKGVTEKNAAYLTNCIQRWANKIEMQADEKLLSGRAKTGAEVSTKLSLEPLYRNDRTALSLYTSSLRQQGIISTDEARALHGMSKAVSSEEKDYATDYDSLTPSAQAKPEDDDKGEDEGGPTDPNEEQQSNPDEAVERKEPGTKDPKADD